MGMMIVRHKVRDYGQWRPVFDRHVEMQKAAGLTNPRVMRATIAKITTAATVNGLFIACIDHLEREKRGWAGIKPRRPHFAFSAG
jgi:hypothetical protein